MITSDFESKWEIRINEKHIESHESMCRIILIVIVLHISAILFNVSIFIYGSPNYIIAFSLGVCCTTLLWMVQAYGFELNNLKHEYALRSIFEEGDAQMREIESLQQQSNISPLRT